MKTKVLISIAAVVIIIISTLYYTQGGFNEVEVKLVETPKRTIVGKHFTGNINSEEFKTLFETIKKMKLDNNLSGSLGSVFFNDPEKNKDEIKAFFGVFENTKIDGFENYTIDEGEFLEGSTQGSAAFVNKTYTAIFDYAQKNSISLEDYFVEWFPSEKEIFVQIKIKNEKEAS